eukprot:3063364-Amphidinium_carterae.1
MAIPPLASKLLSKTGSCLWRSWARLPALVSGPFNLLGGDWNFEPDNFPIDLVHGATVHRPLSDEAATSPVTHGEDTPDNGTKIDRFLISDHNAVRLPVDLKKVSQGFRGQPDYEDPTETDAMTIAN